MKSEYSFTVIIPTLDASAQIEDLLCSIENQTCLPVEVIIVDSESCDDTVHIAESHSLVRIISISRGDFDHGGTRNMAFNEAKTDYVIFMTQDAIPADEYLYERLLRVFEDQSVGMASARQLPKSDARPFERLVREYNYPPTSNTRTIKDVPRLGLKAYFATDVCAAYRRSAVNAIGGIPSPCETNEDMLAAARMIRKGFSVAYVADACVYHSHNLKLRQQYERNRSIGQFLRLHDAELAVPSEINEGVNLMRHVVLGLVDGGHLEELIPFFLDCLARYLGNRAGRNRANDNSYSADL